MRRHGHAMPLLGVFALVSLLGRADPCRGEDAGATQDVHVIDLEILSSNMVSVGSNTMSLAAATNLVAGSRDHVDVIAVRGRVDVDAPEKVPLGVLDQLARIGIPLILVEKGSSAGGADERSPEGMRTVTVGSEQWSAIRRVLGDSSAKGKGDVSLRTSLGLDPTGAYELRRVEVELFGGRVWLMQEQEGEDGKPAARGIVIRHAW